MIYPSVSYNKEFIYRFLSRSISVRSDKLKIAAARGELAEDTLTFIDQISTRRLRYIYRCIHVHWYMCVRYINATQQRKFWINVLS